jgi:hypothetical protein
VRDQRLRLASYFSTDQDHPPDISQHNIDRYDTLRDMPRAPPENSISPPRRSCVTSVPLVVSMRGLPDAKLPRGELAALLSQARSCQEITLPGPFRRAESITVALLIHGVASISRVRRQRETCVFDGFTKRQPNSRARLRFLAGILRPASGAKKLSSVALLIPMRCCLDDITPSRPPSHAVPRRRKLVQTARVEPDTARP